MASKSVQPTCSGIYAITNMLDSTRYIGQAQNVRLRWNDERKLLRAGRFENIHLQRAWDRDGESAFTWEVVEECSIDQLDERETWWIANTAQRYNFLLEAGTLRGVKRPPEACANISKGRTGISPTRTEDHKASLREAHQRYREEHPDEAHAQWQSAVDASAEKRRGIPLKAEHRAKVSAGLVGKRRPPRSAVHIARLKAAAQARMADPARRAALSQTMRERGIAPSMDARQKGADARKK